MPPKIEAAKTATFETDDKRAQYARLAVFNYGVQEKIISKDKDVNTVSNGDLQKAFKSLTGGNLLEGKDGIDTVIKLTKKGATDAKVAERGLTLAYAQEVRPFLKRGLLSANFGRRGKKAAEKSGTNGGATSEKAAKAPKAGVAKKSTAKKTTAKPEPSQAPAPVEEPVEA